MLEEVGQFCFDFNGGGLYPNYREGDDCILGIVRNEELLELYSAQTESDEYNNDLMVNLNRLKIEKMDWRHLELLHYLLVDEEYFLSKEVLDYCIDHKLVSKGWAEQFN